MHGQLSLQQVAVHMIIENSTMVSSQLLVMVRRKHFIDLLAQHFIHLTTLALKNHHQLDQ